MKDGTEPKSVNKGGRPKKILNRDTVSKDFEDEYDIQNEKILDFMNRVELAKGVETAIEASDAIIKHFMPRGLDPKSPFFIYKGIIISPIGKLSEVDRILNMSMEEKMHGTGGGIIVK